MVNLPRRGDGGQCRGWRWPCSARVIRDQSTGSGTHGTSALVPVSAHHPRQQRESKTDSNRSLLFCRPTDVHPARVARCRLVPPSAHASAGRASVGPRQSCCPGPYRCNSFPIPAANTQPISRRPSCPSGTATIVFPDGIGIAEFCLLRGLAPVGVVPKPRGPRSVRFHRRSPR